MITFEIIFYCLLLGAVCGVLSGLLGIGGGTIIVPGLLFLFQYEHFNPTNVMHLATGTSLAIVALASARALYMHHRIANITIWPFFRLMLPGIIGGTMLGGLTAFYLQSYMIELVFAIFLIIIAASLFSIKEEVDLERNRLPSSKNMIIASVFFGFFSGLLGIGGGTLIIPFLIYCKVSMREAVVISLAGSLVIALIGSLTVAITGQFATHLPAFTTGYIYWPAWLIVGISSLFFVNWGVKLSHRLPVKRLKQIFAVFLLIIATKMLIPW